MPTKRSRHVLPCPASTRRFGMGLATVAASAGFLAATAAPAAAAPVGPGGNVRASIAPPGGAPPALLHPGSSGTAVAQVQRALHIAALGRYDAETQRAVRHFQGGHGLAVDGIVGQQTWDALFGIKPPPAPAPTASSTRSTASSPGSAATSSTGAYSIPSNIVQCESGGNYSAVNPSSGAGGAYQIMPSTWQAYGGQGLPQDASPAEQGRIASEIYATQGRSAWSC